MNSAFRRELAIAVFWSAIPTLLFLDKPFHMDEAWFMALARHAAAAPGDPLGFSINLYGSTRPATEFHAYGLIIAYLMAPGAAWAGTREWLMRLLYLPVEMGAAGLLYALASRFLKRPLVPVLLVLAAPQYWLNSHLLTAERWVELFGFAGLYGAVRAADGGDRRWLVASSAAFALATASKYSALVLAVPAGVWLLTRGVPPGLVACWAAGAASPALLSTAATVFGGYGGGRVALQVSLDGREATWRGWVHRLRAVYALIGGGTVFLAVWPLRGKMTVRTAVSIAAAAALFLPFFDQAAVRPVDRALGLMLCAGPAAAFAGAPEWRRLPGGALWLSWLAAVLALQVVYWSVVSRSLLFAVPPLVFALAAAAEKDGRRIHWGAAAAVLGFGLALGSVDARHAAAQKDAAAVTRERFPGRTVWYTGHWGFQHYMSEAGARPLEESTGWDQARVGDVVVVPLNNTNLVRMRGRRLVDATVAAVSHPLPLRLTSAGAAEAGFYSSAFGFLPFSITRAPVEEYRFVELRSPP